MNTMQLKRLALVSLALAVSLAVTICCGASTATAASARAAGAPAANERAARGLSGTWSGTYGGAYHGTFTLHWTQTGSRLNGTIKLSTGPNSKLGIKGTVKRGAIRFGTVGSMAITYSGSVSGESMSGSYQTPGGGGSWSAHKTS
jgi:hypothetical protein